MQQENNDKSRYKEFYDVLTSKPIYLDIVDEKVYDESPELSKNPLYIKIKQLETEINDLRTIIQNQNTIIKQPKVYKRISFYSDRDNGEGSINQLNNWLSEKIKNPNFEVVRITPETVASNSILHWNHVEYKEW